MAHSEEMKHQTQENPMEDNIMSLSEKFRGLSYPIIF